MPTDSPLSTAHLPRPDPARGVFETLLVADGRPVELDAHLARLAASARELFGPPAMARVLGPARSLAERAAGEGPSPEAAPPADRGAARRASPRLARLRLTLAEDGHGRLDVSAVAAAVDPAVVFPAADRGPTLAPVAVPGGLGSHKWADRRLLDGVAGALGGPLPLILDADGDVLETERANVFVVRDGALITPPADGRILPGLARARATEIARELGIDVREERLALDDLAAADELFLTGSIRGVEPVRDIAGAAPRPAGRESAPLTRRIAAALRERWGLGA